jgi:putative aminopeptidase FrvX
MHTQVEIVAWSDIEAAIALLVDFVCSITETTELRPFYCDN